MKTVAVYCGSSDRIPEKYLQAARRMGEVIAGRGMQLVFGAGSTGMMGAVARGALDKRGEVIGVMPEIFDTPQLAFKDITRYELVPDMHSRKARIADISDGFIALPGGYGTLEEFFEIVTWAQIGLHDKPVGLLNTDGYYDSLMTFLKQVEEKGFMYKGHRELFQLAPQPDDLLDKMLAYKPPPDLAQWVDRE
jgi:uncharacterized protein (TIGR00730 family)